jgi:metallo-beta-lactamase family protein
MKDHKMQFQIKHHGAVNGVTGSCHELTLENGDSILIDCGLFQGAETSASGSRFDQLTIDFPVQKIKALIVTHVHIDHVGRIPYLLAAGFNGPIICSEPSAQLLPLVLEDAIKIGFTRDKVLVEKFIKKIKQMLKPLAYSQWLTVLPGDNLSDKSSLKIKLKPAGHILGSAYVECLLSQSKQKKRIVFSGDLGAPYSPLLPAPKSPYAADVVVLESTYGDRLHEGRKLRQRQLQSVIENALQDRGVILIPAFSIGRTQELLYELESIIEKNQGRFLRKGLRWDDLEVIVDSPLAARFTRVYKKLKPYWDREAKRRLKKGRHPLSFEQMLTIDKNQTHLQTVAYLAKLARPSIVIAASGMCSGGRIMNYLKALLGDSRTNILFVGYQAAGTPGRDIQKYGPQGGYVELDGERYDIKAKIHALNGYSAHADQKDLINFVKRMRRKPSEIRLVHGDNEAKAELKAKFNQLLPESIVIIP